jgi:thiamine biosynthesis lipoprotein
MNTDVAVTGDGPGVRAWFEEVEATLSRFRPESPLSQLNRAAGRWVMVPPLLFQAVQLAIAAAKETYGAFDPTVLPAMEAAGYSRSFDLGPTAPGPAVPAGRWAQVELAPGANAIRLPADVRLDLGGLGKGLAVDGALERMSSPRAVVNAGGDIALRIGPGDGPVLVDVADPYQTDRTLVTFGLVGGAAATSSTLGRRWGEGLHHIIDPVTGRPAASGVVAATVVAKSAVRAEVLAKSCIVLGPRRSIRLLQELDCHGLLVAEGGKILTTPGMERFFYANADA